LIREGGSESKRGGEAPSLKSLPPLLLKGEGDKGGEVENNQRITVRINAGVKG